MTTKTKKGYSSKKKRTKLSSTTTITMGTITTSKTKAKIGIYTITKTTLTPPRRGKLGKYRQRSTKKMNNQNNLNSNKTTKNN